MEYNSDTTQSEGIQSCDRCERLDWLDENMLCSFCVAWDEDVNEVEAQLDEARAHVDALVKGWVGGEDYPCQYCGHRYNHSKDCVYEAARKWLEAQDGNN